MSEKPPTHTAYALRRESRHRSRWVEIGHGDITVRCSACGNENLGGHHRLVVDRAPIGGWSGDLYMSPVGVKPKDPEPQPERPVSD